MHCVFCDVETEFLIDDEVSSTQLDKQIIVYMRLVIRDVCRCNGHFAFVAHATAELYSGQRLQLETR
jgi:hypothetical protein